MIRVADLLTSASSALAPLPPSPGETSPSSWFDETTTSTLRIAADPGAAARGLSVAQHAERVLGHLCGEPEQG